MNAEHLTWFKSSYSGGEGGQCLEIAYEWRKSSYSSGEGGQCLEVGYDWKKSSHSSGEGGECVEVATHPTTIHIRDSKLADASPTFGVSPTAWDDFIAYACA
ncbi:DUF397 domain-containing protein [Streptomyces sp. NPDC087440]|uniref:DUF397 domain-containing protein n=1 Tax=Streptomyces sp. NPDC087440 TaxID=3365790 RepID=UPI00381F7AA6